MPSVDGSEKFVKASLEDQLNKVFKFKDVEYLQKIGELAVSRSWFGGPKSTVVVVVEIPEAATKEDCRVDPG